MSLSDFKKHFYSNRYVENSYVEHSISVKEIYIKSPTFTQHNNNVLFFNLYYLYTNKDKKTWTNGFIKKNHNFVKEIYNYFNLNYELLVTFYYRTDDKTRIGLIYEKNIQHNYFYELELKDNIFYANAITTEKC